MPKLATPELQQAADDVLAQITDPIGAIALADMAMSLRDPIRKRQMLTTLGRRLEGPWRAVVSDSKVARGDRGRVERSRDAACRHPAGRRHRRPALGRHLDELRARREGDAEVRVAAVEGLGRLKSPLAAQTLDNLITQAKEKKSTSPLAEAAIRTLPPAGRRTGTAGRPRCRGRDAARAAAGRLCTRSLEQVSGPAGCWRSSSKEAADDLKTEATVVLNSTTDRSVRDEAAKLLPLPRQPPAIPCRRSAS